MFNKSSRFFVALRFCPRFLSEGFDGIGGLPQAANRQVGKEGERRSENVERSRAAEAGGKLVMSTAPYDDAAGGGIAAQALSAESIGLMTKEGSISVSDLHAETTVSVLRTGSSVGSIDLGHGRSEKTAMIFNASGAVSGNISAAESLYVFTGRNADTTSLILSADSGRAALIGNAQSLAKYLKAPDAAGMHAGDIDINAFPVIDFSAMIEGLDREPSLTLRRTKQDVESQTRFAVPKAGNPEEAVTDRWSKELETKGWYTAKHPARLSVSFRD